MSSHSSLVESLLDPDAYTHSAYSIELIETHISWLFLVGDNVYKVKKPVAFSFLDFTTLDAPPLLPPRGPPESTDVARGLRGRRGRPWIADRFGSQRWQGRSIGRLDAESP